VVVVVAVVAVHGRGGRRGGGHHMRLLLEGSACFKTCEGRGSRRLGGGVANEKDIQPDRQGCGSCWKRL